MDKSVNDQFITGLAMVVFLEALGFKITNIKWWVVMLSLLIMLNFS